jgi:hypothetical protein
MHHAARVIFRYQENVLQNETPECRRMVIFPVSNTIGELSRNMLVFTDSLSLDDPGCDTVYYRRTDFEFLVMRILNSR